MSQHLWSSLDGIDVWVEWAVAACCGSILNAAACKVASAQDMKRC